MYARKTLIAITLVATLLSAGCFSTTSPSGDKVKDVKIYIPEVDYAEE